MKKNLLIIGLLSALLLQYPPVHGQLPNGSFALVEETNRQAIFAWNAPELAWDLFECQGEVYAIPVLGDLLKLQNPGFPQLPVISASIAIPGDSDVAITVLDSVTAVYPCKPLMPSPMRIIDADTLSHIEFKTDPLYESMPVYPSSFLLSEIYQKNDERVLRLQLMPIKAMPAVQSISLLHHLKVQVTFTEAATAARRKPEAIAALPGEHVAMVPEWLPPDPAVKLVTVEQGVYQVSGQDLRTAGIDIDNIRPATLQIWSDGQQQACRVSSLQPDRMSATDQVLVYLPRRAGHETWYHPYSDTLISWLTWGKENGKRYSQIADHEGSSANRISAVSDTLHLEKELFYYAGDSDLDIQNTDLVSGEGWGWQIINLGGQFRHRFEFEHQLLPGDSVHIRIRLRGTTLAPQKPDHHVQLNLNSRMINEAYFNDREELVILTGVPAQEIRRGQNTIELFSLDDLGAERSQFYVDWIDLIYHKVPRALQGTIDFHLSTPGSILLSGFVAQNITVWDPIQARDLVPSHLGQAQFLNYVVRSAGLDDGNRAQFYQGDQLIFTGSRGHNLVIVDPQTAVVTAQQRFDTWSSPANADSLAVFLNRLPEGMIVLAAVRDEGSHNLNEAVYKAYEQCGSGLIRDVGSRDSWAFIGRKGDSKAIAEVHQPRLSGGADCQTQLYFPAGGDSYSALFDSLAVGRYIAFDSTAWLAPLRIEQEKPSHWRMSNNGADYLVIAHPRFLQAAQQLADYRRTQHGLRAAVVLIDDIYDEFNAGLADPVAIKDFLRYCHDHWQKPSPTYVLLFGDASWDPKRHIGSKIDFVPTFGNPASDVWFACLDGPGDLIPDMHVGRLAVETAEQADEVLHKIFTYEDAESDIWKKTFVFISGGFDAFEQSVYIQQSEKVDQQYVQAFPVRGKSVKIHKTTSGVSEGENRQEILDALDQGAVWCNFIGHGGSWTWDLIFHNPDIDELRNAPAFPLITSMTCHTGRFAEPAQNCFGESFIRAPQKGAIAFLGSSGWGYSYEDFLFLQELYPVVLRDSVRTLGKAIDLAKERLFVSMGGSVTIKNMVRQYNLLGDPALVFALPTQPDLALQAQSISADPNRPSEADSIARVAVRISNFGLQTRDSVQVRLSAKHPTAGTRIIEPIAQVPPVGLEAEADFILPLRDLAGQIQLIADVDPFGNIIESDESNNQSEMRLIILSTHIALFAPQTNALLPAEQAVLKISNPGLIADENLSFVFEIDTVSTFTSSFKRMFGPTPAGELLTRWSPDPPLPAGRYFWRARNASELTDDAWNSSTFSVSNDGTFGWRQSAGQFSNNQLTALAADDRVTLASESIPLYVESAAYQDGNYARIIVGDRPTIEPKRGLNAVIYNAAQGVVRSIGAFDTYVDSTAANRFADFIATAAETDVILIAVKDEASTRLNTNALAAMETIGSQYCRQIGPRDSWCIIGRKGAKIGSVPEKLAKAGSGTAVAVDTLSLFYPQGSIKSTRIGPTENWKNLAFDCIVPEMCRLNIRVWGYDKKSGAEVALLQTENSPVDLSGISPQDYSFLVLSADFSTEDRFRTPILKNWSVTFAPAADLALSSDTIAHDRDSILVGNPIHFYARVHNLGYKAVSGFSLALEEIDLANGKKISTLLHQTQIVEPDSCAEIMLEWPTMGKSGEYDLYFYLDPDDQIVELYETNNSSSARFNVLADKQAPTIELLFDGREIQTGDFVSSFPSIVAHIFDNSPVAIDDTSAFNVMLDGNRLAFSESEQLRLNPGNPATDLRASLLITPQLSDGDHLLEIFFSDLSKNQTYSRIHFVVESELKLSQVLNYPNPFIDFTDFTFILTQPAVVQVKVFTISGRLIKEFTPRRCAAGYNQLDWNGRDDDGDWLANGVYLYKIIAKTDTDQVESLGKAVVMR